MKTLLRFGLVLLFLGCAKEESVEPSAEVATTETQTTAQSTSAPPPTQVQKTFTLPAGAPIPAEGVLLWLSGDDAAAGSRDGKVQKWENALAGNATATAVAPDKLPAVVANALNGHAVVRFDGTDQTLMSSVDIRPSGMPVGTVITVFNSTTGDPSPLRKLYGNDNGGYDRAVGLDDRAAGTSYTVFTGTFVAGYFQLAPNTTYVVVDEYSPKEFSGWVNGAATLTRIVTDWQDDSLPNMYIGGTGTVYSEYWSGDLAEVIVYARKLSDAERTQVEDYLAQKYGVALARGNATATSTEP